jgi:hypothetical protein
MTHSPEAGRSLSSGPNWSRINQWVLWIGLAAAVAWMFYRHNAHLWQLLPFLILLACPLMHLFGHGAHGEHGGGSDKKPRDDARQFPSGGQGGHQH